MKSRLHKLEGLKKALREFDEKVYIVTFGKEDETPLTYPTEQGKFLNLAKDKVLSVILYRDQIINPFDDLSMTPVDEYIDKLNYLNPDLVIVKAMTDEIPLPAGNNDFTLLRGTLNSEGKSEVINQWT